MKRQPPRAAGQNAHPHATRTAWRRRWMRYVVTAGVALAMFGPAPALAQRKQAQKFPPYDVPGLEHKRMVLPWVFAFLFVAGGIAIGMKNPRRHET